MNLCPPYFPSWPSWLRLLTFNEKITGSNPVGGTRGVSHLDGQVGKCIYLDGVTGAYLFYMQRVGVRFPLEVQIIKGE